MFFNIVYFTLKYFFRDTLFGKTQKLAEDLDTQMIANDSVTKELHRVESEIKKRDTEITNLVNGA